MTEYVCKSCGEDWEGESTPFYVDGKCSNCGAPTPQNKIEKDSENPLIREGNEDVED